LLKAGKGNTRKVEVATVGRGPKRGNFWITRIKQGLKTWVTSTQEVDQQTYRSSPQVRLGSPFDHECRVLNIKTRTTPAVWLPSTLEDIRKASPTLRSSVYDRYSKPPRINA